MYRLKKLARLYIDKVVALISLIVLVLLIVFASFTDIEALVWVAFVVLLFGLALSYCTGLGECAESFRLSFDLLRCGLSEPIPMFIAAFLISLGFTFIVEEVVNSIAPGVLDHCITIIPSSISVTVRATSLLILSFASAYIATRYSSRKTSDCYSEFLRLTKGVMRIIHILIIVVMGLASTGIATADLRLLMLSGFLTLILWLIIWYCKVLEIQRSRKERYASTKQYSNI